MACPFWRRGAPFFFGRALVGVGIREVRAWFWCCWSVFWSLRGHPRIAFAFAFAGIRELLACFRRRPCAGRHLLFFAAAKKSRQKKAAHTANSSTCLRAPKGSYTSHDNHVTHVRC